MKEVKLSAIELRVKKIGNSYYLLVPAKLRRKLKIKDGDIVRVIVCGVYRPVIQTEEIIDTEEVVEEEVI